MSWVFALLALGLVVAIALVLAGRLPAVPQPASQRYVGQLPARPSAADVDLLRLPVVLRGYRMDDTDAALAALRDRIAELEAQCIAHAGQGGTGPTDPVGDAPRAVAGEQAVPAPEQEHRSPFAPPDPGVG